MLPDAMSTNTCCWPNTFVAMSHGHPDFEIPQYSNFFLALSDVRLVPKLETLHCDIRAFWDAETILPQLIASFVRSRWLISPPISTMARLRHLTLKFPPGWEYMDQVRQFLAPFRNEGLSVLADSVADQSQDLKDMMRFESQG